MLGKFTIIEDKEEVTESDNLQEIELNSNCYVNNKFIGTTVAKKTTIKILNENEYELENKNIKVELGIEHYNPAQTYIGKNIEIKNAKSIKPQIKIHGSSTQTTRSGKNLFNGTLKAGLFLASNGVTFVQNNNYVCSEKFVSVINGETYSVSNKNEIAGIYYVLEYDENKNFIKASNNSANAASFKTTISSNCCYVRVEIGNSSAAPTVATIEDFQIEKGEVTEYEKHGASPSPDYPSTIENVEGKNKVKEINWKQLPSISTGATVTSVNGYGTDYINVDNTKQYIFSYLGIAGSKYITYYDKNKNFLGYSTSLQIDDFAKWNETVYVRLRVDCSQNSVTAFQLEKGTVATDYVPYNSLEIKDVGENLLNVTAKTTTAQGITFTVNADKSITINGTNTGTGTAFFRLADNFVLPAGNYTLSNKNSNASNYGFLFYDDGNNFPRTNISNATFTEDTTIKPYIRIDAGVTVNNQTIYPIILKGTYTEENIPAYTPYQEQKGDFPLSEGQKLYKRSYLANNGIHHKRKQFEIDVTQIRAVTSYNNIDYASIPKPADFIGYNNYAYYEILCNKAISQKITSWDNTENINKISSQAEKTKIYLGFEKGTTLEQMKTALANTVIEYDLAEEETIPYTAEQQEAWEKIKNLKLFEGTNNIESEAELTITLGKEYIVEGKYKVPKPDTEEVSAHTTFTGYDNMKNFDIPYVDNNTYPKRLDDCLESLCQQVGLVLGSKTFPNNSYMIKGNPFTNGENCKTVLSHLVQLTGGFAEIDMENGNVYVRNFDISGDAVETIDGNNYDEFKPNNVFGPVNSIRIQMNSGVDGEETIKEAEGVTDENRCQITIADNYYLTSAEEREAVINGIFNALNGLTYLPIELSYYGYPWLKLGDKIKVKDKDDKEYVTYVMEHTLKYNGAYSGTIKATALTKTQVAYTETLSIKQWKRNTELSVSKIDGKITQLTEETTENSQKLTQQEQDINGLKTKVSNIQDLTQTTVGNKTIILSNCAKGDLLSLKIKGNNTVFKYLYPSEALYPGSDIFPMGDSRILVNDIQYELGVLDTLRQNGEVYDEFILEKRTSKSYSQNKCRWHNKSKRND